MTSRKKIATNWLGNYELMSGNDLPKNLAVLKHYMYLSTFKYSSNTNGQVIREEIYDTGWRLVRENLEVREKSGKIICIDQSPPCDIMIQLQSKIST